MNWNAVAQTLQSRPPRPWEGRTPCAVLALLAGDSLVLEVRSRTLRHQPGEICLPGGSMEPGETAVRCALRETEEELGLTADRIEIVGELDFLLHVSGQAVYPVLARGDRALLEGLRPNPAEVEEVFAVPLEWFRAHPPVEYQYRQKNVDLDGLPEQLRLWLEGYDHTRRGWYWDCEGRLIWGLTGRIIGQILKLTRE